MDKTEEDKTLARGLSFWGLVALSCGTVTGVGVMLMSGEIIRAVGPYAPLTLLIAMIVQLIVILPIGELASSYSTAGSVATYGKVLLNDYIGFFMAITLWIGMIAIDGAELMAFGRYLYYFFPSINYYWWGIIITIIFLILNYFGVALTGKTQLALAIIMWAALFSIIVIVQTSGQFNIEYYSIHPTNPSLPDWATALFFAVYCFVGFETILPAAEEANIPREKFPKALIVGVVITGVLYILGLFSIMGLRPYYELLALAEEGPFASSWVKGMEVLWNGKGAIYMNGVAIATSLTTANACVYGGARMLFGMAEEKQVPKFFMHLSKYRVPDAAILFTGAAILLTVISGQVKNISAIANFVFFPLWFFLSLAAYLNRKKNPSIPWKAPFGKEFAIGAMIISLGLIVLSILSAELSTVILTLIFLAIAMGYYAIWKRVSAKHS